MRDFSVKALPHEEVQSFENYRVKHLDLKCALSFRMSILDFRKRTSLP